MAGTAISAKQSTANNNSSTDNLNTTSHSIQVNLSCCLRVQQPVVVESNRSKCNSNARPMKEISTNNWHNSSCILGDRLATNCNYNIKTLKKEQQSNAKRPLTLSAAVIVLSLSILVVQMPTMIYSKSVYEEASAPTNSKLLLSLLAQPQKKEYISSFGDVTIPSSSSFDILTALDVMKNLQHRQEHQRERRKRLHKRHTGDLIITQFLSENDHNVEWKNPCNVHHMNMAIETHHVTKQQVYQYLKKFENDVGMEHELITATANRININDIADWSKHVELYRFLPKLTANGSVALSRWYRNMQVYVASFGYLARLQYKFDKQRRMFAGRTSEELNKLLASARFILCELETTINASAPNNNLKKLRTISRQAMNRRLNFVTKHQLADGGGVVSANTVDLKFAKYSYYQFLMNMQKILKHKLQNKSRMYGITNSLEDNRETIIVGDDSSSLDFSAIFKSDSNLSLGESVEMLLKSSENLHTQRHQRTHKE